MSESSSDGTHLSESAASDISSIPSLTIASSSRATVPARPRINAHRPAVAFVTALVSDFQAAALAPAAHWPRRGAASRWYRKRAVADIRAE